MARTGLIGIVPHLPPLMEPEQDEDLALFELRRKEILKKFSKEVAVHLWIHATRTEFIGTEWSRKQGRLFAEETSAHLPWSRNSAI